MKIMILRVRTFLLLILVGCSTPQVISFYNERADFGNFNTFRVVNPTSDKEDFSEDAQETLEQLEEAIIGQMEKRGYRLSHSADLLVYYRILIDQQTDYRIDDYPSRYNYNYYGRYNYYNVRKNQYDQGTLSVEFKNSDTRRLVWQGNLDLKVKSRSKVSKDEIVEQTIGIIFDQYPFEAGRSDPLFHVEN